MFKYFPVFALIVLLSSCSKTIDNTGTCADGIKNQGEQATDCGGPCPAICPSCADGIKNQDETAVDCGNSCGPCYERMGAYVNNSIWNSTSRNAFLSGPGTLRIYGTGNNYNITLYYSGPFTPGSENAGNFFSGELRDASGNLFASVSNGQISFSEFDTTAKVVSGTYSFVAKNNVSGQSKLVTGGVFNVLPY